MVARPRLRGGGASTEDTRNNRAKRRSVGSDGEKDGGGGRAKSDAYVRRLRWWRPMYPITRRPSLALHAYATRNV